MGSSIVLNIRKFFSVPHHKRILFIKCFVVSLFVSTVIKLLPIKYFYKIISKTNSKFSDEAINNLTVNRTRKIINRIEKIIPGRMTCLVKSSTFKIMMNSYGIPCKLNLGVLINKQDKLVAHSWVSLKNDEINIFKSKKINYVTVNSF